MADGALSWLAMVAARVLRRRNRPAPRRAAAGGVADLLPAVRVRRRLGHAGRARAEVLAGVVPGRRARGPDRAAVRAPGHRRRTRRWRRSSRRARAPSGRRSRASTTAAWSRCLELDEALSSELVSEREMVVEIDQPGVERPVRQLGIPVKLTRTPGRAARLPGPALGEHTEEVLRAAGYSEAEVAELLQTGAVAGPTEAPTARRSGSRQGRRTWARRYAQLRRFREIGPPTASGLRRSAAAEDQRAGRALGGERRHDQALPARGPARWRGGDREDEPQHGLLPARARASGSR